MSKKLIALFMLLVMPLILNADVAPVSSASSAGIVDFTFNTPQSGGTVPKVYVDVAKIKLEIQPLMAYMPRAKATYDCIGDNGNLCSKDAVQCNAIYEDPTCPNGGHLNTTRDMCQVNPVNTCGIGYTYDSSIDRCVKDVVCPDGGVFNAVTDRCEKLMIPTCPSGYTVDTVNNICWMAVNCGSGAVFNATKDRCEKPSMGCSDSSYVFNAATARCEMPPQCSVGTYNATYNECMADYNLKCDTANGYTYNSTSGHCEKAPPVCPANSNYNPTTNRCEGGSACTSPAVWDSSTQQCKSGGTSTYAATATTTGGLTYDNCEGGGLMWVNAKNYCESKGMRLPTNAETVPGGGCVPSCNGWTWTSAVDGYNYSWLWSGSSLNYGYGVDGGAVRCVK